MAKKEGDRTLGGLAIPPTIMGLSKDSVCREDTGIELAPHAMQSLLSP